MFTSTLQVQKYTPWKMNGWFTGTSHHPWKERKNDLNQTSRQLWSMLIFQSVCSSSTYLTVCLCWMTPYPNKNDLSFWIKKSPFLSLASNDLSKPKRLDAPWLMGEENISTCSMEKRWCKLGIIWKQNCRICVFFFEVGTWSWNGGFENRALYC